MSLLLDLSSLWFVDASDAMSIKVMEPITTCLLQKVFFKTPLSRMHVFTLPVICIGVLIFLEDTQSISSLSLGLIWGISSNVSYGLRNIYMKELKSQNVVLSIRSLQDAGLIVYWILSIVGLIVTCQTVQVFQLICYAVMSSLFHLSYTHLSITGILSFVSVITHAVFNVTKRILVVLFFVLVGDVVKTTFNWLGLILAAAGMTLHFSGQSGGVGKSNQKAMSSEQCHTLPSIILGLLLVGFQITALWDPNPMSPSVKPVISTITKYQNHTNTNLSLLEQHHLIRDRVVNEIKLVHIEYYTKLLQGFPKVAIIELADYENKGDPAITVGEMMLMKRIHGTEVIYYNLHQQSLNALQHAKDIIGQYNVSDVLIMFQGGGGMFAYPSGDIIRRVYFNAFPNHTMAIFPQSIWAWYPNDTLAFYKKMYNTRKNLHIGIRDPTSLARARELLPLANLAEVPDMAFHIGPISRTRPPVYDILYHKRQDKENIASADLPFPPGISFKVADWVNWRSSSTQELDIPVTMFHNGLSFLQRGKVVISNRLHSHILTTLIGIPHVIMECKAGKILPLHYKWTKDIPYIRVANNISEAVKHAIELLEIYGNSLPDTLAFDVPIN
eukprot:TCALIF_12227-PA protein Name:"Similar to pvg1 Pyruvyl transferase 1 (Schizosaccharomyces pombe (strain 972 / ATCC 24843))" AED:0.05 eAED:0.05 QI:0/0.5/0.33/0.66/1/1/3/47/612